MLYYKIIRSYSLIILKDFKFEILDTVFQKRYIPHKYDEDKHTCSNSARFIKDLVELKEIAFQSFLALSEEASFNKIIHLLKNTDHAISFKASILIIQNQVIEKAGAIPNIMLNDPIL